MALATFDKDGWMINVAKASSIHLIPEPLDKSNGNFHRQLLHLDLEGIIAVGFNQRMMAILLNRYGFSHI